MTRFRQIFMKMWAASMLSAAVLAFGSAGCTKTGKTEKPDSKDAKAPPIAKGETVAIGFIYVGPRDDYGYNQAHAAGAKAVKAMPNVKVAEEEKVPETVDVQKT